MISANDCLSYSITAWVLFYMKTLFCDSCNSYKDIVKITPKHANGCAPWASYMPLMSPSPIFALFPSSTAFEKE
jgi:hypothetical protein